MTDLTDELKSLRGVSDADLSPHARVLLEAAISSRTTGDTQRQLINKQTTMLIEQSALINTQQGQRDVGRSTQQDAGSWVAARVS